MKNLFLNLLCALLSVSIFLSVLEFGSKLYAVKKHKLDEYAQFIELQGFTPENKKPGQKRVFIMGESAARGVPYSLESSYSGFLQKLIDTQDPNVKIINSAIPGRHSFYLREEAKVLLKYKADTVIIYAGNNDTRDFSNVMRDVPLALLDFKLTWNSSFYRLLKNKIMGLKKDLNQMAKKDLFVINYNQDDVWHWTDKYLKKKKGYLESPELGLNRRNQGLRDFEINMNAAVSLLKKRGVQVFILGLPIVHEFPPVISDWSRKGYVFNQRVSFGSEIEKRRWSHLYRKAQIRLAQKKYQSAISYLEKAKRIDASYPLLYHNLGKAFVGLGNYEMARQMYAKAKALQIQSPGGDAHKNEILKQIAAQNGSVFVDLQPVLEEISPNGIVGKNLFLDHCHANSFGHKALTAITMQYLCSEKTVPCSNVRDWKFWLEKLIDGKLNQENMAREYLLTGFYMFQGTSWSPDPDYVGTIEYLEKARDYMPENKDIYPFLAVAYWKTGQIEKAKNRLDMLRTISFEEYRKTLHDFPYLSKIIAA